MKAAVPFQQLLQEGQVWLARGEGFLPAGESLLTEPVLGEPLFGEPLLDFAKPGSSPQKRAGKNSTTKSVPVGLGSLDARLPLGGLACNTLHEFLCDDSFSEKSKGRWHPSLIVSSVLFRSFLSLEPQASLVWVGRRCFPTPHVLDLLFSERAASQQEPPHQDWQERAFFLHSKDKRKRIWAISQLLQSPAPLGILADGSRFSQLDTRRLQHACERSRGEGGSGTGGGTGSGVGKFLILLRPAWEQESLSVAETRWLLSPSPHSQASSSQDELGFSLELLRAKGKHVMKNQAGSGERGELAKWMFEVCYEKNSFGFREVEGSPANSLAPDAGGEDSAASAFSEIPLPLLADNRFR